MKKASTSVYRLIQAMTPSEKRYFQQYAGRTQSRHLQLFRILNHQPRYDEDAARRQMPGKPGRGHFAVLKRQLMEHLLDCLGQYHRDKSPAERLKRKLHAARILQEKGLFSLMEQELKASRKLLGQYQLNRHWPELLALERSLVERGLSTMKRPEPLRQWQAEWQAGLDALQEEGRFAYYSLHIAHQHYKKIQLAGAGDAEALQALVESENFQAGRNSPQLRCRMDYFRALSTYHFMQRQARQALQANAELLRLFEDNAQLMELYPQHYLAALNNYLIDHFQLRQWPELEEGLKKLKGLPARPLFRKASGASEKAFEQSAMLELNMLLAKQELGLALTVLPEIESGLRQYGRRIAAHNQQALWYLMSYICFRQSRPDKGLELLNELLQARQKGMLEELNRFANLLQLLLHYELGNYELLPYLITSVRRQHQGLKPAYRSEQLLFDCLRRLLGSADKAQQKNALNRLSESIENEELKVKEARFFEYLDLSRWPAIRASENKNGDK
ncbi:MAG: hypothetical protein KDC66_17280 [Phaeodactylibacter sp.]|nr:hypothetical protein [Phaeodactylibacter sp.]MCB9274112.1 hypothetical protein [Lewinellaceae bacterium]